MFNPKENLLDQQLAVSGLEMNIFGILDGGAGKRNKQRKKAYEEQKNLRADLGGDRDGIALYNKLEQNQQRGAQIDKDIAYHEKTLGQLFCDGSSKQIINMLLEECKKHHVTIKTECSVSDISKNDKFTVKSNFGEFTSNSLVIATGRLSIPKIGASDFGYEIAKKFGHNIIPTAPALVPLTISEKSWNDIQSSGEFLIIQL